MAFYEGIKLEKGMYAVGGKSFTKVLEEIDPSENYKGTELEGLDAYQRQLKRFNIKVSGVDCDKVEKFFGSHDSAVLFPEYIARAVKQGINSSDVLDSVTAVKTKIDAIDYRAISYETQNADGSAVSEGAAMPSVNVKNKSTLVSLTKHGRLFSSTYEALRFQNLDVLTVILGKIGEDIAAEQFSDAVNVLLKGDGSGTDKADEVKVTYADPEPSAPTLSYSNLLQLWEALGVYKLNTMVASTKTIKDILSLSEMKDANAGLNFQGTGNIVTPVGAKLIKSSKVEDNKIVGFDRNKALQMIQYGNVIIDYDKVIDRQLDRASISVTAGFTRIFKDAVKILNYNLDQE